METFGMIHSLKVLNLNQKRQSKVLYVVITFEYHFIAFVRIAWEDLHNNIEIMIPIGMK